MKKSTRIRLWLWLISGIVLLFVFLTQCTLKKPQLIANIISDCAKNVPFSPVWQSDLKRFSIQDEEGLSAFYCHCVLEAPLEQLTEKEIASFPKLTPEARIKHLGGEAGMQNKNDACLRQWSEK